MEDILAITIVLGLVIASGFGLRAIIKSIVAKKAAKAKAEAEELQRQIEASRKWRESTMKKALANTPSKKSTNVQSQTVSNNSIAVQSHGNAYVSTSSSSVDTSDFISDIANIAIIANTVRHWNDNSSSSSSSDDDSRKSSSSWGFSSSDSSSDSGPSFSDSGPSSDW